MVELLRSKQEMARFTNQSVKNEAWKMCIVMMDELNMRYTYSNEFRSNLCT